MGTILQDIRYALRMQRKNPGFTAVALITLALGIGANTAIFSVVYGILLRPLPYVHPERIVQLCESYQNQQYEKDLTSSGLQFLQAHAGAFQSLAAFTNVGFNLAAGGSAEHVNGLHVSSGYFRVLGVDALIGRTFSPEEDSGDGARVAILSEGLWKRMGSDRSMLGRTVLLDGSTYTVVGVMPGDFERLNTPLTHGETEVWAPMALVRRTVGSGENLAVIGRLKDGISLDQARSQVGIVGEDFRRAFPDHLAPASRLDLEPYQTMLSSDSRTILMVLFGAVFLVLLIACANIANLLLGRAVVRGREIAIRTALGGSRARLFRQLVTESLLLSMLGALAGVGLALMLLTGAVLLTETFWRVLRTDPGFNPSHVLSMQVWLNGSKYDSTETVANFYDDVLQRIQHLPGVQSAAVIAAGLPLERGGNMPVEIPGRATPDGYGFRMVTPEYFRTMGIPLKAGRFIDVGDNPHGGAVAVVSESLAKRLFPNQNVLGEHLRVGQDDSDREIVGVVGDVKSYLDQPAEPTVFIPVAQAPYGMMKIFESWFATSILVRTAIDPLALSHSVQEQLRAADPSVASGHIRTMEQVRSTAVAMRQFNMTLLALFAALASALAALGIYGVMAYNVRQRTHEIGVRVAFGAQRSHILGMIYREALLLASIGIAIGTACALALTRLLESYLYEVKARDPVAFVGTVLVLGAVAMLACVIPARRAVKVDPMVALRYE